MISGVLVGKNHEQLSIKGFIGKNHTSKTAVDLVSDVFYWTERRIAEKASDLIK